MLSQLPAMQHMRSLKNGEASHSGQLFNQIRQGENRKMASGSLYLDELLIQKV